MNIQSLKGIVSTCCTVFHESRQPASLSIAVNAIFATSPETSKELGLLGVWLLHIINSNQLQIAADRIEAVRAKLLLDPPCWKKRFFQSVLSDANPPASPALYIEALQSFRKKPQLYVPNFFKQHSLFCIEHAKQVGAKELIKSYIRSSDNSLHRGFYKDEYQPAGDDLVKILQGCEQGEINRKITRGIDFPSLFRQVQNNFYFLRWLPDDFRRSLDTLYISADERNRPPVEEVKGILPIKRIVVTNYGTTDCHDWLHNLLTEIPDIKEVHFARHWGSKEGHPLTDELKNRLRSCAIELYKVIVTTRDCQDFVCELFGMDHNATNWTVPLSFIYRPANWQPIFPIPFAPRGRHPEIKSFMQMTIAQAQEACAGSIEIKKKILDICGVAIDSYGRGDINVCLTRDEQLAHVVQRWICEAWQQGALDQKVVEATVKQWTEIAGSVHFLTKEIKGKEGRKIHVSELPLRLARENPQEPLPSELTESTALGLMTLNKLINTWMTYPDQDEIDVRSLIEATRCAGELKLKEFLHIKSIAPHRWTEAQVQELKEIAANVGQLKWFAHYVTKVTGYLDFNASLPVDKITKLHNSGWWKEIIAQGNTGLYLPENPIKECLEIVKNPTRFEHVTAIKWMKPTDECEEMVINLFELLPKATKLVLSYDFNNVRTIQRPLPELDQD